MARRLPIQKEKNAPVAFFFLMLYTFFVLVRPHEFSFETANLIIIKVLTLITILLTILSLRPIRLIPQHFMLFILVPFVIMSGLFNGWLSGGINQANILIISAIIPFFLFSNCITSIQRQHIIMYISLLAALFMVYNGHLQFSTYNGEYGTGIGSSRSVGSIARQEIRITYFGFFSDPNDLGMFLVMNFPFAIYFLHRGNFFKKIIMLGVISALFYGVYMTGSRGTLLGILGIIGIYFLFTKAGTKLIIFSMIVAPLAATLLASFGGVSSSESSAHGRLDAWYVGVHMLLNNPIFGIGMGNFIEEHNLVAHNSYIHIAAELGIFGYSIWGGVLIVTMLVGFLLMKKYQTLDGETVSSDTKRQYQNELLINKTLFFSMVGFMITAFFLSRSYSLLLFIFLGLLTASHLRVIKIRPELKELFSATMIFKSIKYSWLIIFTVFIAMKIGL
ncbi:O-antigen ligase family protein [Thalassotalea sp. G2M2-11]|uniref:O-antigen ligase family protein n=1 Tax=Thalassotalea sp. G2M2-11 TaxID=2787627 RepID=UPI0019D1725E|nr:O-antigen ligase family protein [Thalassotalea sp. G2M2-11]